MGRALPGVELWVDAGELVAAPASVPTFFLGYLGEPPWDPAAPWRTGDRVRMEPDGHLFFEGRTDDVIISAGYRIGPFEVESALVEHPALARELQDHVKATTAPYRYPRIVDWADALPRTPNGKVRRALLRGERTG
jgi:acyl-coenzyme A synthetase/AMP-(fatty) acid ligase